MNSKNPIDLEEYQEFVYRICSPQSKETIKDMLATAALGLTDESGEVAGLVKKHLYHGHPMDQTHLIKELGDVLWYLTLGAIAANSSLHEVIQTNMEKLRARYAGDSFSSEKSLNRAAGDL